MSKYTVYISACRGLPCDAENTAALRDALDRAGLPSVAAVGCYGGVKEASFKVSCDNESELLSCFFQARLYNQECILVTSGLTRGYIFMMCNESFEEQLNNPSRWTKGGVYPVLEPTGDHTIIGGCAYELMQRV